MLVRYVMGSRVPINSCHVEYIFENKANLRYLTAATGLVILLKSDSSRPFISLRGLEI